ncbi:thiamine pyrophosphate-dependent enzyme [Fusibacter sp. 3D3]|uniref:thiamine pyrophosphate-dependent enzyme n=1 Tax=Fusibacter sp. 3D3 TaxID=1048380 RepID=UPI000852D524|nr:thiamine pyrophosphate-dependent enzyme [Fusibacter sp. 3D3]GAU79293.1 indolepyruvate oxidoreductase subunit IorA [Fusibacter sp. 3D3]
MKKLMTSNEAVAQGSIESGVAFVSGYPGTPCTEIVTVLQQAKSVKCEWSTNEKVALEVAIGTSLAGYRSLVVMKTLGLNVAADAFTQLAGTPINGGIVIVVADDIGRIAGDDYQDCRSYGIMSSVPVVEPSNSQEAKDFVAVAFQMSEAYMTPVIFRLNSILCKSKTVVSFEAFIAEKPFRKLSHKSYQKTIGNIVKFGFDDCALDKLKDYWHDFNDEWQKLKLYADETALNKIEKGKTNMGIIATGIAYYYAKEIFPDASFLKLGMVYPLAEKRIRQFIKTHQDVYLLEDGHPLIEKEIKSMGLKIIGEDLFPRFPEMLYFTPDIIENKFLKKTALVKKRDVPIRLPTNCKGCPHHAVNEIIKKHDIYTASGIGCGGLGALPHVGIIDVVKCMGSSFGIAHGYNKANPAHSKSKKMLAIMGDGEFWHTGINNLINMVHNESATTVVIEDNMTIAMTGGQPTVAVKTNDALSSIESVCRGIGVRNVRVIDSKNIEVLEKTILDAMNMEILSVIISRHPCVIFNQNKKMEAIK